MSVRISTDEERTESAVREFHLSRFVTSRMWNSRSQQPQDKNSISSRSIFKYELCVCALESLEQLANFSSNATLISFFETSSVFRNTQLISLVKFDQGLSLSKIQKQAMLVVAIFLFCTLSHIVIIHNPGHSIEDPWPTSTKTPDVGSTRKRK